MPIFDTSWSSAHVFNYGMRGTSSRIFCKFASKGCSAEFVRGLPTARKLQPRSLKVTTNNSGYRTSRRGFLFWESQRALKIHEKWLYSPVSTESL